MSPVVRRDRDDEANFDGTSIKRVLGIKGPAAMAIERALDRRCQKPITRVCVIEGPKALLAFIEPKSTAFDLSMWPLNPELDQVEMPSKDLADETGSNILGPIWTLA